MWEGTVRSNDGCTLTYAYCDQALGKPWIVLIIPFGLKVEVARAFFDFFADDYNILTWEARLILSPPTRSIHPCELTVAKHVADLVAVLDACSVKRAMLVGYCSGAGVALAAGHAVPDRFNELVLVNGEYTLLNEPSCVTQFGSDIDSILTLASRDARSAAFILERMQFILNGMSSDRHSQNGRASPPEVHLPFSQAHYFHRYALNYLSYRATDFMMLARAARRRVLLISGLCDLHTNVTSSRKIQRCIPGSRMWVEPSGDHYELLRFRSSTLDQVRRFLSTSDRDSHG